MKNRYEIRGEITIVFAKSYKNNGIAEFLIDTSDLEKIKSYPHSWSAYEYVSARKNDSTIFLHKFLVPSSGPVDHINRNKMDNRRSNLREVNWSENAQNTSMRSDNKSGFRGVMWCKTRKKWMAYCKANGKVKYFGFFDDVQVAAVAAENGRLNNMPYVRELKQLYGIKN